MGYTNFTNGILPAMNDETLNNMQIELMKLVFPIGSIYITQDNTNPSEILKFGTWERVKGKVLVGLDENDTDFNVIGKTGGEKTHKLSIAEMPSHNHSKTTVPKDNEWIAPKSGWNYSFTDQETYIQNTDKTGGDQPHNNLQPYRVVGYMWLRTA